MRFDRRKTLGCITLVMLLLTFGCGGPKKSQPKTQPAEDKNGLGPTIGMLTEVFASDPIVVRGYGLIGGLNGTGSSECPPQIRQYLEKYILQHLSSSNVKVDELIKSTDTAVVTVEGIIPPAASQNQRFDVRVVALSGTQTTSLEGGWLYGADLYDARQFGTSIKSLATVEGPVYVDVLDSKLADARTGYVLGGGQVASEYKIDLVLRHPDYRVANQIRNRINERFGYETSAALAAGAIELRVPSKYINSKERFIQLVKVTYLAETPELVEKRTAFHIQKLGDSQNKLVNAIALEAIGNSCLTKMPALLNSSDPEVRFLSARCMLHLGDIQGRKVLWDIAKDRTSPLRLNAIETIANSDAKQDAVILLQGLLGDEDFAVRFAACEDLVRLGDVAVSQKPVANSFYLDEITQSVKPAIFISRQKQPRVILLGAPIYCRSGSFIETSDGTITINAPAGQQVATIIRKHPRRPGVVVHLQSSLDVADIIQALCKEPAASPAEGGPGLGVSYSTLVGLLKQMVDNGAIEAEFHAGPLPGFGQARTVPVKNPQPDQRPDTPKSPPNIKK